MKKFVFIVGVLIASFCVSGCSKDEAPQDNGSDYCYTGIVKYIIPEVDNIQVVITEDPRLLVTDQLEATKSYLPAKN